MLVSPTDAFEEYQLQEAWTWEHQALVRARAIYSDAPLKSAFEATRAKVLSAKRDQSKLKKDVADMREKMRSHLGGKRSGDLC